MSEAGARVWFPHQEDCWQLGTVISQNGRDLRVESDLFHEEHSVPANRIHPFDPTHEMHLKDIAQINNLHEAPLLDLLRRRFSSDDIYTYTSDIG